ncbi:hypothetical protein AAX26_00424 [Aliarcobacter thereius]|uniref:Flagellar protein FlgN n=2 Tax=Aliarcobacter thereius TaxID=544718 RepID=A0A1C0B937_9BACT|nr:hypothetical protein [Aliarcobacter thereius]OCL88738.1 hypothetical protein AAX26_00424 [Aliarcobacter thereius]OCL92233.1 hypothetical protein AAX25_00963 [Aliarcobacter thereius]OCL94671.1 hypothetical protein AA347_00110 [Aliarcobacter thereius LMG 24486]OCM00117.1 hypothetical protein AAX29_00115 [Aliarcobacter thereius]QBF15453.1 hypothetical protein ATH_0363 [Aliarcobacter thereius LMG 24486]
MIDNILNSMNTEIETLKEAINLDILDIKAGRNEELFQRNDMKYENINSIMEKKTQLNNELAKLLKNNIDVNVYREKVDYLEQNLKELYELNKKLANIVLPIKQMYKELVDEVSEKVGGHVFDIKA